MPPKVKSSRGGKPRACPDLEDSLRLVAEQVTGLPAQHSACAIISFRPRCRNIGTHCARAATQSDDVEANSADSCMLTMAMNIVTAPLRLWEKDREPGGTRMPRMPRLPKSCVPAHLWGRCFVLALPSRAHLTSLLPFMGDDEDAASSPPPWMRYVHAMDVRFAFKVLDMDISRLPDDDSVLVAVGYYQPVKDVPTPQALDTRAFTDPALPFHFTHMRAWIPCATWHDFDQLGSLDTALAFGRHMALRMMIRVTLNASVLAARWQDLDEAQKLRLLRQHCLTCGTSLRGAATAAEDVPDPSPADEKMPIALEGMECQGCKFVRFCGPDCLIAASTQSAHEYADDEGHYDARGRAHAMGCPAHRAYHCRATALLIKATDPTHARRYWGNLSACDESMPCQMDVLGRFTDPARSTLLWDVGQPASEARIVPGIVHAHMAWHVRKERYIGWALEEKHWQAYTRVCWGDTITLTMFGNATVRFAPGSDQKCVLGDPVSLRDLIAGVHATLDAPVHHGSLRAAGPEFIRHFGCRDGVKQTRDISTLHRRFVSLVPKAWVTQDLEQRSLLTSPGGIHPTFKPWAWRLTTAPLPWAD